MWGVVTYKWWSPVPGTVDADVARCDKVTVRKSGHA